MSTPNEKEQSPDTVSHLARHVQEFRRRVNRRSVAQRHRWHTEKAADGSEVSWSCIPYTDADQAVWDMAAEREKKE